MKNIHNHQKKDIIMKLKLNTQWQLFKLLLGGLIISGGVFGYATIQWALDFIPLRPACEKDKDEKTKKEEGCKPTATRGGDFIMALIPLTKTKLTPSKGSLGELTYQAHPTFWFYTWVVPSDTKPTTFKLITRDESGDNVYEKTFSFNASQNFGIVSFQLPQDAPELEENKIYYWQLSINGSSEYVEGLIQRKPRPSQLSNLFPQQKMEWYAENGIWYDLITLLGQLRRQNPDDAELKQQWDSLFDDPDVDLGSYKNQPFLDCCSP